MHSKDGWRQQAGSAAAIALTGLLVFLDDALLSESPSVGVIPVELDSLALGIGSELPSLPTACPVATHLTAAVPARPLLSVLNESLLFCEVGTPRDSVELLLRVHYHVARLCVFVSFLLLLGSPIQLF